MAILRNVAKTDTLEIQRQKINLIADDVFNIESGGSDLSTGNLKLGDGTRTDPSLAFVSDPTLGIYKPSIKTMAFVSDARKIYQFNNNGTYYFRDIIVQKNTLKTEGIILTNGGQNYDSGSYSDIACIGGTGELGTFDIVVSPFSGITSGGSGYIGTATGNSSTTSFSNVNLLNGSGTGVIASIVLDVNTEIFQSTSITNYGSNYAINDVLTLPVTQANKTATITLDENTITLASTSGIYPEFIITKNSGTGAFNDPISGDISVSQVIDDTTLQLSTTGSVTGTANLTFTPPWGTGTGYNYTISKLGVVTSSAINAVGNGYSIGDTLTSYNLDLTKPIIYTVTAPSVLTIDFTTTVTSSAISIGQILEIANVGDFIFEAEGVVIDKLTSGSNISKLTIRMTSGSFSDGSLLRVKGTSTPTFTIDTVLQTVRFYIDKNDGNGEVLHPDFTLYKDSKYTFDYSSIASHPLYFSIHQDGVHNEVTGVTSTLTTSSTSITVSSSTGILPGMTVTKDTSIIGENGQLDSDTTVVSVVGTTVVLSKTPTTAGAITLIFRGAIYSGNDVTVANNSITIQPSELTPSTLYYFCDGGVTHTNEAGFIGQAATITIDLINPKTFGSGFLVAVDDIDSIDVFTANVADGKLTVSNLECVSAVTTNVNVSGTLTAPSITGTSITASSLSSSTTLSLTGISVNITGDFNIGSSIQIVNSSGNLTTSGILKTTNILNINDILTITNNTISTSIGNNIQLSPPIGRVAKINGTTALIIPVGSSSQRPNIGIVEDGAIRFNTDTNQYEGYSATTTSWSSLGGVRDLDGNTYIAAEAFTGANDNILYFFNDNNNTLKLTTNYLDFNTVKKISSLSTSLPTYTEWTSNTPVLLNAYVKYRNNLYLVTTAGTTGTSGNEPIHTTGSQPNGTTVLEWYISAVAPLAFEEIQELRVGPLGNLPLVINSELRLANNVISTDAEDLVLRPNSGKKLTIDAATSLVIPAGDINSRGNPSQGSIRFNTTLSSFEGYSGANWTSLGGVKDVDGNTYIIPETAPAANENILYFFNDGENTLQLSKTALNFQTISRITSTSDTLEINAELVSFDSFAASIDNSGTTTFISSTKDNLDLGLSVGLVNSHLLRLNTSGDIIVNKGFGTASPENIKVLDNELKDFELSDVKISSSDISLVKGTNNTGSSVIYSPATASGAKIVISAHNTTTNDKEFVEYSVCDKGSNIYNAEYGNISTGVDLFGITFDFDNQDSVRITAELSSGVQTDEEVIITIIKTIIKK